MTEPSLFTSSSTGSGCSISFCVISDSLFLIIIVGDSLSSALLYPLNLIDCPNLLCIKVSPSYNFNLWIVSLGVKYSPYPSVSPPAVELDIPVLDVDS